MEEIPRGKSCSGIIQWWCDFAQEWNGCGFFYNLSWTRSPDVELFTDASGLGFGGVYHPHWVFFGWPHHGVDGSGPIMVRELRLIALDCVLWGQEWKCKKFLFQHGGCTQLVRALNLLYLDLRVTFFCCTLYGTLAVYRFLLLKFLLQKIV